MIKWFAPAATAAVLLFPCLVGIDSSLHATPSPNIVISQVYGGGGNSGAPLAHDYIELFNRGTVAVSLGGWSLQYASAAGTGNFGANTGQITELPFVTLAPGQYFLVQQAGGASGGPLPVPDLIDPTPINMSGTGGKVALVSGTTSLGCNGGSMPCPSSALARIIDLVGYDGANFFEGTAAPALTNTTAALRVNFGCTDTDSNGVDFLSAAPAPRNTASPLHPCSSLAFLTVSDAVVTEGNSGFTTAHFTVNLSAPAPPDGVVFDIATADDTAIGAENDYQPSALPGQVILGGQQTYAFDVVVNGDIVVEPNETFLVNVTGVVGATVSDGQAVGTIINDDAAPPVNSAIVISQVYGGGGNSGATLTNDFIELFNRGATTVDITGWSVQYNSATGTGPWQTTELAGTIPPGGYYLIQEAQGAGGTTRLHSPDATGTIAMGAASGKVALRTTSAAFAGACPAGGTIVDLVGYGVTMCHEGTAPAAPLGNTLGALRKRGGCFDSNDNGSDLLSGPPAPRNSLSPPRSCDYTTAAIHDVQGPGAATPFAGRDVITEGVVTGLKINGFFLQAPDNGVDADPATSEGIFVFTSAPPAIAVGDAVTVRGTATEFFGLTQIESTLPGDVSVRLTSTGLPFAVDLTTAILDPSGAIDQLERFEGMRVHADALMSVAPTNSFGETATVLAGVARPMREPGIEISLPVPPDPSSGVPDCCIPRFDENPERLFIDSDGLRGAAAISVTSNVVFSNVTGPLDYSFGHYKVLPEAPPAVSPNMSAVAVSPPTGEFTVGGFNIENFVNDAVQRRKAALAIRDVMRSPDVIDHVEILNLTALQALAAEVNGLAVAAGEPDPAYEAVLMPAPLGGTQNVGFLVKTARVRIDRVSQERASETFLNPVTNQNEPLFDRPPLVLYATVDPAGVNPRDVIVVVSHLRSFIDIEPVGGEGPRVRAKRTAQAESTARLLQELQRVNRGTPIIAVGDFNAYQFSDGYTDPVAIIRGVPTSDEQVVVDASPDLVEPNFVNLTDTLPASERYTFTFDGTPQALDHVIVNDVGYSYLQRYVIARSNADFPDTFSVDVTRPERSSDHDMPVAYFCFPPTISGVAVDRPVLWPPNHRMVDVTVAYSQASTCGPVHTVLSVTSTEPIDGTGDGDTSPDWQVVDAHRVRLRAERAGGGSGRTYVITITATDSGGRTSTQAVMVTVPKSR